MLTEYQDDDDQSTDAQKMATYSREVPIKSDPTNDGNGAMSLKSMLTEYQDDDDQLTDAQRMAIYNRDRVQIQTYKHILTELHAAVGSDAKSSKCWTWYNFWKVHCWIAEVQQFIKWVGWLTKEVHTLVKQSMNVGKQLLAIGPLVHKLGICIATLPGHLPLDKAFVGLNTAVQQGRLIPYIGDAYVNPLFNRVEHNWSGAVKILQHEITQTWHLFTDGKINETEVARFPRKMVELAVKLLEVDPTGKCLLHSNITSEVLKLADVPIFAAMFRESLKTLQDLWAKMEPVLHQMINWFGKVIKDLFGGWLRELMKPVDKVVADAINVVCVETTSKVYGWAKGVSHKLQEIIPRETMCKLKFEKLLSDPKVTIKAVMTAVLSWASKEIMSLMDQYIYAPMMTTLMTSMSSASSVLMQGIVALCGLIPFVGGAICSAISTPLSWVLNEGATQLVRSTIKGFINLGTNFITNQIPVWAQGITDLLMSLINQGVSYVDAQIPKEVKEAGNAALGIAAVMAPILKAVSPFFLELAQLTFPSISGQTRKCEAGLKQLGDLVACTLCVDKNPACMDRHSLAKPEIIKELDYESDKTHEFPPIAAQQTTQVEIQVEAQAKSIHCKSVCSQSKCSGKRTAHYTNMKHWFSDRSPNRGDCQWQCDHGSYASQCSCFVWHPDKDGMSCELFDEPGPTKRNCDNCREAFQTCNSNCDRCSTPDHYKDETRGCNECESCLENVMKVKSEAQGIVNNFRKFSDLKKGAEKTVDQAAVKAGKAAVTSAETAVADYNKMMSSFGGDTLKNPEKITSLVQESADEITPQGSERSAPMTALFEGFETAPQEQGHGFSSTELMQMSDEQKMQLDKRDHEAIEVYKTTLIALHAAMGTGVDMKEACGGQAWNVFCWMSELLRQIPKLNWLWRQAATKGKELVSAVKQLAEIKPLMEHLGKCISTLPGFMPLDKALAGVGNAVTNGTLVPYLGKTYVAPVVKRTERNWNLAVQVLQTELHAMSQNIIVNGKLNHAAITDLPSRFMRTSIKIMEVDPTMKCFVRMPLMKELKRLIDFPIFNDLFGEAVRGMLKLWDSIEPAIQGVIKWMGDVVKWSIKTFITPLFASLDKIVADAINLVCVETTKTIYTWTQGIKRADMCKLKFSSLVSDSRVTVKAVLSAVLMWATKEIQKLLDVYVYQPMIQSFNNLITWANGGLMQIIVGLCGLIPEVGGLICGAITGPLTTFIDQAAIQLSSGAVKLMKDGVQGLLDSSMPGVIDTITEWIVGMVDAGTSWVKAQIPPSAIAWAKSGTAELKKASDQMKPVTDAIKPIFMELVQLTLPKITDKVKQCASGLNTLGDLIKQRMCLDGKQQDGAGVYSATPDRRLLAIASPLSNPLIATRARNIHCADMCYRQVDMPSCTRCQHAFDNCHTPCTWCESPAHDSSDPANGCEGCQQCLAQMIEANATIADPATKTTTALE
jgi:hypothetical protein